VLVSFNQSSLFLGTSVSRWLKKEQCFVKSIVLSLFKNF